MEALCLWSNIFELKFCCTLKEILRLCYVKADVFISVSCCLLYYDFLHAEFTIPALAWERGNLEAGDRIQALPEQWLFLSPEVSIVGPTHTQAQVRFHSHTDVFWIGLHLWLYLSSFQNRKHRLLFFLNFMSSLTSSSTHHPFGNLIFPLNFLFCSSFMEILSRNYVI